MKNCHRLLSCVFVFSMVAIPARSDTLNFHGVAASSCALTAPVDGVITLGADLRSWGTTTPATINATNTAPATVSVTRPTAWASSPASTPVTTFTHTATFTGTNVGTLTGIGSAQSGPLSALGNTVVTVSLAATATAPFPAGAYNAQVTVTCTVP